MKVPLFQCEFDALVSLLYNAGVDLKAPKLFTHL
ncbi:glycoside hydrolase family protein, partial [Prevotella pallens]